MMQLTGAEALVRSLLPEKVPYVFGVVGGKLNGFLYALSRTPAIRYVGTRHEGSGPLMAAAIAAASGRMCVAIGEMGPGSSNLVSTAGVAYNNNLPLLLITSNNLHACSYPNRGMFMELETRDLFRPVTKWNAVVHDGRRIPELVRTAFREAQSGRPGPVHLDVPQDAFITRYDYDAAAFDVEPENYRVTAGPRAPAELTEKAADLLAQARRPLLLAGGGVARAGASALFRELADLLKAPATTTQMGLGVVASDAPCFVGHGGIIGGSAIGRAFDEADLVLAVGCRFSSWLWDDKGPLVRPGCKLININVDPGSIGRVVRHDVGLLADARLALADLLPAVKQRLKEPTAPEWRDSLAAAYGDYRDKLAALAADRGKVMHPAAVAQEIARFMPRDALVTYDGGHTSFWSNDFTPVHEARTRFHDPGMSQLGFGTPYAVALKLHYPDRPVFNIIGDGAFGFTIQELDTARRYGLPIVNIIHNNASWGIIKAGQRKAFDFMLGADLTDTNYAEIATGFGCHGEVVTKVENVGPALQRALDSGLPAVVDCHVRFEAHPAMPNFGKMNSYGFPPNQSFPGAAAASSR
jgi:acetolactate synthase-1/2/3 large subunit